LASWRNLFSGRGDRARDDYAQPSGRELQKEYVELVTEQLRRIDVPADCVHLDVASKLINGRNVFNVKIRLVRWHRTATLRLLVSLPLLEARTRKAVTTSWVGEVSQFGGLWVHSSATLSVAEVEQDSEWAISELQLLDTHGAVAADRLRKDARGPARSRTAL
jgi:hypothetical protein